MNILVTGGIGYIGSHTIIELLKKNHNVIVIDNLSNSNIKIKLLIEEISGKKVKLYKYDLRNYDDICKVFREENIDMVIHFAALKSVSESVEKPLEYYDNNIVGTINLLQIMKKFFVKKIVFSSSATVYSDDNRMPVKENDALKSSNPYGNGKIMIENILNDIYISDNDWDIIILRYFNPVGAHESGKIGELPVGIPNNLMPYISEVAFGELEYVRVFGNDYNTKDGTGVRDYIHVVDLAKGHVAAVNKLVDNIGLKIYNLGTGKGYSVLEVIEAFKKATNREIKYKILGRRPGDIPISYADSNKAKEELCWEAKKDLQDMCKDFWRWQCTGMVNILNRKID